jgi:hypothetical protein
MKNFLATLDTGRPGQLLGQMISKFENRPVDGKHFKRNGESHNATIWQLAPME